MLIPLAFSYIHTWVLLLLVVLLATRLRFMVNAFYWAVWWLAVQSFVVIIVGFQSLKGEGKTVKASLTVLTATVTPNVLLLPPRRFCQYPAIIYIQVWVQLNFLHVRLERKKEERGKKKKKTKKKKQSRVRGTNLGWLSTKATIMWWQ